MWTWWDVLIATCISCLVVFLHNLYQYHPPMTVPPPTTAELMGLWGDKRSEGPLEKVS